MIVYIHGASATCESFNYITQNISVPGLCLSYESKNGFKENLSMMSEVLTGIDEIFFVAHSLGGIYSLHLAEMFPAKVRGAVTLSTPYGGSKSADYVKYFLPFSRLMRDIGPHSDPMEKINKIDIKWPWTNVVTINGASPFMIEPNDGVVTIASMKHLENKMEIIEMPINHYEVVITDPVIDIIKQRLPADFISK